MAVTVSLAPPTLADPAAGESTPSPSSSLAQTAGSSSAENTAIAHTSATDPSGESSSTHESFSTDSSHTTSPSTAASKAQQAAELYHLARASEALVNATSGDSELDTAMPPTLPDVTDRKATTTTETPEEETPQPMLWGIPTGKFRDLMDTVSDIGPQVNLDWNSYNNQQDPIDNGLPEYAKDFRTSTPLTVVDTSAGTNTAASVPTLWDIQAPSGNGKGTGAVPTGLEKYYGQQVQWRSCQDIISPNEGRDNATVQKITGTVQWASAYGSAPLTLECGYVKLPEDYNNPSRGTLAIPLLKAHVGTQPSTRGPLFMNPGGPGVSGISLAVGMLRAGVLPKQIVENFDIVGFDPRGVGSAVPLPVCLSNRTQDVFWATEFAEEEFPEAAESKVAFNQDQCNRNVARGFSGVQGIDYMRLLTTDNMARDLDALRSVLGAEKLNYLGYSWGGWLGLRYATLFPQNIRAMVNDSVQNPFYMATDQPLYEEMVNKYVNTTEAEPTSRADKLADFARACITDDPKAVGSAGNPNGSLSHCTLLPAGAQPIKNPSDDEVKRYTQLAVLSITLATRSGKFKASTARNEYERSRPITSAVLWRALATLPQYDSRSWPMVNNALGDINVSSFPFDLFLRDLSDKDLSDGTTFARASSTMRTWLSKADATKLLELADQYWERSEEGTYSSLNSSFYAVNCADGANIPCTFDAAGVEVTPVKDLPTTLVVQNTGDSVTTIEGGILQAALMNATLVVAPGQVHGASYGGRGAAYEAPLDRVVTAYLMEPDRFEARRQAGDFATAEYTGDAGVQTMTANGSPTIGHQVEIYPFSASASTPSTSVTTPAQPSTPVSTTPAQPSQPVSSVPNTPSEPEATVTMQRLYNPNSGEHFYTASTYERDELVKVGWKYEGVAWVGPVTSDRPVYRVYNPYVGDHHYTTSSYERDQLVKVGWRDEGIGWYSAPESGSPIYRAYNPNAVTGAHHYTLSKYERDQLVKIGWREEGIGWYALGEG